MTAKIGGENSNFSKMFFHIEVKCHAEQINFPSSTILVPRGVSSRWYNSFK